MVKHAFIYSLRLTTRSLILFLVTIAMLVPSQFNYTAKAETRMKSNTSKARIKGNSFEQGLLEESSNTQSLNHGVLQQQSVFIDSNVVINENSNSGQVSQDVLVPVTELPDGTILEFPGILKTGNADQSLFPQQSENIEGSGDPDFTINIISTEDTLNLEIESTVTNNTVTSREEYYNQTSVSEGFSSGRSFSF